MANKEIKVSLKTEEEAWLALQKIKEAEENSRLMIDQARQKTSPGILRKATEEAEEMKKKIISETKAEAEKKKKDIVAEAEAEARRIREEAEAEKQKILKITDENFSQAVERTAAKLSTLIKQRKS